MEETNNRFIGLSIGEAVTLAIQESYEDILKMYDMMASNEAKELKMIVANKDLQGAMSESAYTSGDLLSTTCGGSKYKYTYNLTEAQQNAAKELDTIHEGFADKAKDFAKNIFYMAKNKIKQLVFAIKKKINEKYVKKLREVLKYQNTFASICNKLKDKGKLFEVNIVVVPGLKTPNSEFDTGAIIEEISDTNAKVLNFISTKVDTVDTNDDPTGTFFENIFKKDEEKLFGFFKNSKAEKMEVSADMFKSIDKVPVELAVLYNCMETFLNTAESKLKNKLSNASKVIVRTIVSYAYKVVGMCSTLIFRALACNLRAAQKLYIAGKKMGIIK